MNGFDLTIFKYLNSFAGINRWLDDLIIFQAEYLPWLIVAVIIFLFILEVKDKEKFHRNWKMGWEAVFAGLTSRFVFAETIRFLWDRSRPFELPAEIFAKTGFVIHKILDHESGGSFPSGHASFFFAIAASAFFYRRKWGRVFLITALLTGIGRVAAGLHWPSDIFGGIVVGVFSAWLIHAISYKIKNGAEHTI